MFWPMPREGIGLSNRIFKIPRLQIVGHFEFLITSSRGRNLSVIRSKSVPSGPNLLINMGDIS